MKDVLRKIGDWAEYNGWSIPVFLVGILFGLSIEILLGGSLRLFEVVAAWGTLGAAFAAFWSVNFSRSVQRKRDIREDDARKPSLQIVEIRQPIPIPSEPSLPTYIFKFANLSQQAIYLSNMYVRRFPIDDKEPEWLIYINLTVPPYGFTEYFCLDLIDIFYINEMGDHQLFFYFTYAMTGSIAYRLKLPIAIRKIEPEERKLKGMKFKTGEQCIEGPLKPRVGHSSIEVILPDD